MIRIPVSDGKAWEIYGTHWVQLDAPRHFFIHSVKSMKLLAEQTVFEVSTIIFDSAGSSFGQVRQICRIYLPRKPMGFSPKKNSKVLKKIRKSSTKSKRGIKHVFTLPKKEDKKAKNARAQMFVQPHRVLYVFKLMSYIYVMDNELIRIFSEELRETKKLVVETSRMADAAMKGADAAMKKADAAMKKADAAWELVVITRNQIKEEIAYLKLPLWKKIFRSGNSS